MSKRWAKKEDKDLDSHLNMFFYEKEKIYREILCVYGNRQSVLLFVCSDYIMVVI